MATRKRMSLMRNDNAQVSAQSAAPAPIAGSWADAPCAHVTRLVADILGVPVALLSLPRADEYRFRVNIGLDGFESVPCRISFCAYTMLGTDVLVVNDARVDARFHQNPLVLGSPRIVTYVGVPLISSRGVTLGTLCAIDHEPREFTSAQLEQLRSVARIAAGLLEAEAAAREQSSASAVLAQRIQVDRDEERERLAVALHEGVAQDLFALRLQLQRLRSSGVWRPEAGPGAEAAAVEFTRALDRSIRDVCGIANGLQQQLPANLPVADAIRRYAQEVATQTGLEIQLHVGSAPVPVDSGTRRLLLGVVREALSGIARHARACNVNIILECSPRAVSLKVIDDGVAAGAESLPASGSLHMAGARECAVAAGGSLTFGRNVRGGTTMMLQLPRVALF
jgi:signal transduction histidine kinase